MRTPAGRRSLSPTGAVCVGMTGCRLKWRFRNLVVMDQRHYQRLENGSWCVHPVATPLILSLHKGAKVHSILRKINKNTATDRTGLSECTCSVFCNKYGPTSLSNVGRLVSVGILWCAHCVNTVRTETFVSSVWMQPTDNTAKLLPMSVTFGQLKLDSDSYSDFSLHAVFGSTGADFLTIVEYIQGGPKK